MTVFRIGTIGRDPTIYTAQKERKTLKLRVYTYPSTPDFYKSEDVCDAEVWIEGTNIYCECDIPDIFKYYNFHLKAYFSYDKNPTTFILSSVELVNDTNYYDSGPSVPSIGHQFLESRLREFLK